MLESKASTRFRATHIKICGLKQPADVKAAVDAGADAVGFVLYAPSVRHVSANRAGTLARGLPRDVTPVLLFVNPTQAQVRAGLKAVPRALLQFHGDESPAFCDSFERPYLRAVAMKPGVDLVDWRRRFKNASALLLDAPVEGYGGGGKVFNWSLIASAFPHAARPAASSARAQRAGASARIPVVLSGGLNAANVIDGVLAVRPCAVDVSSGVERAKGVKDAALIRQFCDAVRQADDRLATMATGHDPS